LFVFIILSAKLKKLIHLQNTPTSHALVNISLEGLVHYKRKVFVGWYFPKD